MSKAPGGALLLGASGALIAGPPGMIIGAIVGAVCGLAADDTDRERANNEAFKGVDSSSGTGKVAGALEKSGRKSVTFTSEKTVSSGGKTYKDTKTRTVKRK